MESLSDTLREAREARGYTLEDVERALRIKARHLQAIEFGEFDALPSPAQTRGFLRNYAAHLGLDPEQILARYDELARKRGVTDFLRKKKPSASRTAPTAPHPAIVRRRFRFLSADLFISALITLTLLAVIGWGGSRLADAFLSRASASPTVSAFLLPTLTPTGVPVESALAVEATPSPLPPLATFTNVQLQVLVEQRSYLRVTVDGAESFAGMVAPGESRDFVGSEVVEVTTGNGAGIHVFFNQRDQGILGRFGEVVTRLWTLDGAITPTPTETPIPSETPAPSRTPRP